MKYVSRVSILRVQNVIFYLVKRVLSLFPVSSPFKLYNALLRVPLLNRLLSHIVLAITPDHADIPEGRILFDSSDPVMAGAISFGQFEPTAIELFRSSIKPGMHVVDIGANLGYFTVIAAHRVGPSGKVFAYEPDPHNVSLLETNIATNKFENVQTFPIALSNQSGTRKLFFGDNHTTHSFSDKRDTGKSEVVVTDTLDNSLKSIGSPNIDLIKMDIEGAEPFALEGMQETLANNAMITIFFEYHPNAMQRLQRSPVEFLEKLMGLGFTLAAINEDQRNCIPINNIEIFAESFRGKELSVNLIGHRARIHH